MLYIVSAVLLLIALSAGFWLTLHMNKKLDD